MTTTVEAPAKRVEQTEAQNELRGLLAAALLAVKEKNKKNLMTYLALAMAKADEL
jgi:hypothetical protein